MVGHIHNWKGGSHVDSRGYRHTYAPQHPRARTQLYVYDHILMAEKALGKPLPKKAVVHHLSETIIVICQNQAYHLLLHRRQRAFEACRNPNFRRCKFCKEWDHPKNLYISPNTWDVYHRSCSTEYYRRKINE